MMNSNTSGGAIRLLLPKPPSSNHRMILVARPGQKPRMVLSPEHRAWKAEAVRAVVAQLPPGHRRIQVGVVLSLTAHVAALGSDLSNLVKTLEDALTAAGVWVDDRQVAEIHQWLAFATPGAEPHIEVEITEACPVEHAELNRRLAASETRAAKATIRKPRRVAPATKREARGSAPTPNVRRSR